MNCPPAQPCGSSLGIMPAKIYPHFDEFCTIVDIYWRDNDLPEQVAKLMRQVTQSSMYRLTPGEIEGVCNSAVYMAERIREVVQGVGSGSPIAKQMVGTMLNWRMIYGNPSPGG